MHSTKVLTKEELKINMVGLRGYFLHPPVYEIMNQH